MIKRYNEYLTVRLDEKLKKEFEAFCDNCEITASEAINLMVKSTIKKQRIPFQVRAKAVEIRGIHQGGVKQDIKMSVRIDKESREEFKAVCKQIGIPMGRIVKMFMAYCVKNGKMPF